eukprot:6210901-Pleurochrysis_carterae.AAC.2
MAWTRFRMVKRAPSCTLDRVILVGHHVRDGLADADVVIAWKYKAQIVVQPLQTSPADVRMGADEFDGKSHTVGNFNANVCIALRDTVGGKENAIAACRVSSAAVEECNSRAV